MSAFTQKERSVVIFCANILDRKIIGLFKIDDSLEINAETYSKFFDRMFLK